MKLSKHIFSFFVVLFFTAKLCAMEPSLHIYTRRWFKHVEPSDAVLSTPLTPNTGTPARLEHIPVEEPEYQKKLNSLEQRFALLKNSQTSSSYVELHAAYDELDREAHEVVLEYFPGRPLPINTNAENNLCIFRKFVHFRGIIEVEKNIRFFQERIDALKGDYVPLHKAKIKKAQEEYRKILQDIDSFKDELCVEKTPYILPYAYKTLEETILRRLDYLGVLDDLAHSFDFSDDLD